MAERCFRAQSMMKCASAISFHTTITFDLPAFVMSLEKTPWMPFDNPLTALCALRNGCGTAATTAAQTKWNIIGISHDSAPDTGVVRGRCTPVTRIDSAILGRFLFRL